MLVLPKVLAQEIYSPKWSNESQFVGNQWMNACERIQHSNDWNTLFIHLFVRNKKTSNRIYVPIRKWEFMQWKFVHKKECKHHHEFFYSIKYWPTNGPLKCKINTMLLNTINKFDVYLQLWKNDYACDWSRIEFLWICAPMIWRSTGFRGVMANTFERKSKETWFDSNRRRSRFSQLYSKHSMCSECVQESTNSIV